MNEFSQRLENHYSIITNRFASAETVSLDQIRTMIDHGMTTSSIALNIVRFAERVSLIDRMLMLADLKAELLKLLKKGEKDENIKAACLRLGWELADFMPGSAPYAKQISIGDIRPASWPENQADEGFGLTD